MGVKSRPKKNRLQIGTNFFALRTGCLLDEIGENEDMKFVRHIRVSSSKHTLIPIDGLVKNWVVHFSSTGSWGVAVGLLRFAQ